MSETFTASPTEAGLLASFYDDLRSGGFAQVLLSARGSLAPYDHALERSGATREHAFFVAVVHHALAHMPEYLAFMDDRDAREARNFRAQLQLLSACYLNGEPAPPT